MNTTIDIAARHRTVTAVLRKFRGFAKLAQWKGQAMSYRQTHDVIDFKCSDEDGQITEASKAASEARATELCALLRSHGLTVNWCGSYAITIEVKLDAPLIDVAAACAV